MGKFLLGDLGEICVVSRGWYNAWPMLVEKMIMPNGFRVVLVPMASVSSATVQVFVKAGSRNERGETNGLAHFLEHVIFKGTERYPTAFDISSIADGIGAEMNASTDKECTSYYLKVMKSHIPLAFDVLSDFVRGPLLKAEEIEKEKGVIMAEIDMCEDLPARKAPSVFEELLYPASSLGWDVIGKKENIARMKREDFEEFMKRYYNPGGMVLSVAGNFDKRQVLELAEEWFGGGDIVFKSKIPEEGWHSPDAGGFGGAKQMLVNLSGGPEVKVYTKKTEQTHVVVGVRGNPLGSRDRHVETVLSSILGGGMSSRLFCEVREKRGLAYYIRTELGYYTDAGYLAVRMGVREKDVKEAIGVVLEEFRKIFNFQFSVSKEELAKAKEYSKGRLALFLEDTEHVSDFFGEQELFEGEVISLGEFMAGIDGVSVDDVCRVAGEFFKEERLNLAIVGPFEDGEKFRQVLKL